jgi:LPXTG-motif cell wall-anchored protein
VELKLADREDPNATTPVFWIEFAEKPLINLFWLGTTLMVFGGLLALRKRERQWQDVSRESPASTLSEGAPVEPETEVASHAHSV